MMSSEIPSEKYSCSGSPLILLNGSTAIDGLSASATSSGTARFRPSRRVAEHNVVDAHRELDVLELLLANVLELEVEPVADIIADRLGHRDAARFGDAFEPCCDINAIAKDIVVIDDHVAKIDADAELNPPVFGYPRIANRHFALDLRGALDRIHNAGKFDQHAVAGQLDDSSLVFGDGRIDQLGAMGLEASQRADFIGAHQPAVADYVGGKDRG